MSTQLRGINVTLQESVTGGYSKINEEEGVIYGVRIIGTHSKNKGRVYPMSTLRRAKPLYEEARININHVRRDPTKPPPERPFDDFWGVIKDIQEDGDGLFGDLHYLKTHEKTPKIIEAAKRFPNKFGLSHDARGEEIETAGGREVIDILEVRSVDLVLRPATNEGLFESEDEDMSIKISDLAESLQDKHLLEMISSDPMMGDVAMPEMGSDVPAGDQVAAAFRAACVAVIDDSSLDSATKIGKIKQILKAKDQAMGIMGTEEEKAGDDSKPAESDESGDETMTESEDEDMGRIAELQEQIRVEKAEAERAKQEVAVVRLLQESQVAIDDVRIRALLPLNDEDRKALVKSFGKVGNVAGNGRRPASSPSVLQESKEDVESFKKSIFS